MQFVYIIAVLALSYFITAATTKKPQTPMPALFKDFQFPTPTEGAPQAVIFGDVWTPDWQVLWVGNYRTETINQDSGKK